MMKNNKRLLSVVAMLLALLTLAGCSGRSVKKTANLDRPAMEISDIYADYVIPWYLDASAEAKKAGTMDFYFMSANGYVFEPGTRLGSKWGDSCLIAFPNGETMLIDGGDSWYGDMLKQNLKYLGVEKIDYLVMSHPHSDHVYGLMLDDGIFNNFEVGHIYYNGMYNLEWSNPKLVETTAERYGIPLTVWKEGDSMEIGGVSLEILGPGADCAGTETDSTETINNSSLLMRFDYGEFSALFTGDLYAAAELDYVKTIPEKLDVDLLKVPHHGGKTSSRKEFVEKVSPEVAVVTGGADVAVASYSTYKKYGADIYMELFDGYVFASSDGKDLHVETSHERTTDMYSRYDQ